MVTQTSRKTTFRADDLTCPSCVAKIEASLTRLDGVRSVDVHFATGRIVVEHDPSRVGIDDLRRAIAEAGYTARPSAF